MATRRNTIEKNTNHQRTSLMNKMNKSLDKSLEKFFNTPGKCTIKELNEVKKFFKEYIVYRDLYKTASGHNPLGQALEVESESAQWYIDFQNDKRKL